jgi:hypothetical protein
MPTPIEKRVCANIDPPARRAIASNLVFIFYFLLPSSDAGKWPSLKWLKTKEYLASFMLKSGASAPGSVVCGHHCRE